MKNSTKLDTGKNLFAALPAVNLVKFPVVGRSKLNAAEMLTAMDAAERVEIGWGNVVPLHKAANGSTPEPDRNEAERFLELLDPTATSFTFQTFDDDEERREVRKRENAEVNKRRKEKGLKALKLKDPFAHIIHGTLNERWKELCKLNAQRAGIFITVNETDGKGRAIKNIKRVRALFNDLDGAPLEPVMQSKQTPHLVVELSPGKFHAYRFIKDIKLDQFEGLQKGLAAEFDSDPSVHDLPRVLRLPGFLHQKDKLKPFLSHIVSTHDAPPYSGDDFKDLVAKDPVKNTDESNGRYKKFADQRYSNSQWQELNDLALANLAAWVRDLFPTATPYHEGFRVSSADLGRANDEDLSFRRAGIKDFGVHDLDDPREGKRTPIDVVMEWGFNVSAEDLALREHTDEFEQAVEWLRERLPKEENADRPKEENIGQQENETVEIAPLVVMLAKKIWGEPNGMWKQKQQYYFNNSQVVIDAAKTNWFDFESNKGGGIRDLMKRVEVVTRKQAKDQPSVIVCAADIEMRPQDWLWKGHLQRGAQELLSGQPDLGKSQVQMHYIACATARLPWPDGALAIEPMNVLMLTAEDTLDQIVVPRLHAAGADVSRVFDL